MKRDMDLIRELLLRVEAEEGDRPYNVIEGFDEDHYSEAP
jgi:hypothetical protein